VPSLAAYQYYNCGTDGVYLKFSRLLRQNSSSFLLEDIYRNPGPLQFEGPGADSKPISLCVEDQDYMGRIKKLQEYLAKVVSHPCNIFSRTNIMPR
jgi:hypothetical protein